MQKSKQNGFSLLELTIVITIMGFSMISVGKIYTYYNNQKVESQTQESLDVVISALSEFQARTGRYPCPADPTLGKDNALYGFERCTGGITTTGRDADGDTTPDNILIGSIPFRTMSDPDGDPMTNDGIINTVLGGALTTDGVNNRITYAVTQNLTNMASYDEDLGAITVVDEYDQDVIDPPSSTHLVVLSHGPNGRGAYSADGNLVEPCGTVPGTLPSFPEPVRNEIENCNNDNIFVSGIQNRNEDHYYDDELRFLVNVNNPLLWVYTGPNQVMNNNTGFVGVGTETPEERLHIDGDLLATTIYAEGLCDAQGDDCMPVEALGGDMAQMQCSTSQVMIGVENNQVICADPAVSTITGACPAGEFIYSVSNKGDIRCALPTW